LPPHVGSIASPSAPFSRPALVLWPIETRVYPKIAVLHRPKMRSFCVAALPTPSVWEWPET
jgi:hypothetical protein